MMIPLAAALLLAATPASTSTAGDDTWRLVWSDEFDAPAGAGVDAAVWSHDLGTGQNGWGNNELQVYTDDPANVAHDGDGHLVITARQNEGGYTSGRILTQGKREFTYGRVEARIQVPTGQGIWPAFWMLGGDIDEVSWPRCGEIDVMEHIGSVPNVIHGSIHGPGYSAGESVTEKAVSDAPFPEDFRIYAVDWLPDRITWYVDGEPYFTATPGDVVGRGGEWVFDKDFFVLLNVAVGGNWPGPPDETTGFPQSMTVDYVRVYELVGDPPPAPRIVREPGEFFDGGRWLLEGNAYVEAHNAGATPGRTALGGRGQAMKLFGDFDGDPATASAAVGPTGGAKQLKTYTLTAHVRINSDDAPPADDDSRLVAVLEFLDANGRPVFSQMEVIADASLPRDEWVERTVSCPAPPTTASVRAVFRYEQDEAAPGAVWVDGVELAEQD